MKKSITIALCMVFLIACQEKTPKATIDKNKSIISSTPYDRFESARIVLKTSDVPFIVYSKHQTIRLYSKPNEKSKFIDEELLATDTLYGETEVSNFYKIIYQVGQIPEQSKYAYVLKSDVYRDNELELTEQDHIDELKFAVIDGNHKDVRSFEAIGTIELIDKVEYNKIFQSKPQYLLSTTNPPINNEESYVLRLRNGNSKTITKQIENISVEYEGYAKYLDRHFFKKTDHTQQPLYFAVSTINETIENRTFNDIPVYLKSKQLLASFANTTTGSTLVIERYNSQDYTFKELIRVQFTNFKVSSSKKLIWKNDNTLLAEVFHPKTRTTSRYFKKQYIKLHFSDLYNLSSQ